MKKLALIIPISILILSCGGGKNFKKNPVDELIIKLDTQKEFTIILADMDVDEQTFSSTYKHRYKVITNGLDSMPKEELTDWYVVSEEYFDKHINDLGMELCSKSDGKVEKVVSPPGYSNYVGNQRYGSWQTDASGNSFWAFYGQYAFMSSMIGLMTNPIYRSGYYDYRNNYRTLGQPYYGTTSTGAPAYGTYSSHSQANNPNFHNRLNSSSAFRNKVNNSVSRSTSGSRSKSSSSRSGSRSSGSARRSGGGGK